MATTTTLPSVTTTTLPPGTTNILPAPQAPTATTTGIGAALGVVAVLVIYWLARRRPNLR